MNKIFLPAIFATALALTACGKKEDQAASDGDTTPAQVTAPATTEPATAPTTEMQDLTAPAKSTDTDSDKTSELLDLTAPQDQEAKS